MVDGSQAPPTHMGDASPFWVAPVTHLAPSRRPSDMEAATNGPLEDPSSPQSNEHVPLHGKGESMRHVDWLTNQISLPEM